MIPQDLKNLSLYCFSALIQADAAIFGLLAVFIVYRMQTLGNNQINSFNYLSTSIPEASRELQRLMLPISVEEIHSILIPYISSPFYSQLLTIAFTQRWKEDALKTYKPAFYLLIVHIGISSWGLFYANELSPVLFLNSPIRTAFGLVTFILLLTIIAIRGYMSLSETKTKIIPPPASIPLTSVPVEDLMKYLPTVTDRRSLYSIRNYDDLRFIDFRYGISHYYTVLCLLKSPQGTYLTTHSKDNMHASGVKVLLEEIQSNPDNYWSK